MEIKLDLAKTLWASAENIRASVANLEKLFEAFDNLETQEGDLHIGWDRNDSEDDGWLRSTWMSVYEVKKPKAMAGRVTIGIQLCSDAGAGTWDDGERAKVLVGYVAKKHQDFWSFNSENPDAAGQLQSVKDSAVDTWRWHDKGDDGWCFALRLESLTSEEAVKRLIVTPLHHILRGQDVDLVLAEISDHLLPPPSAVCCA